MHKKQPPLPAHIARKEGFGAKAQTVYFCRMKRDAKPKPQAKRFSFG
ncbi:MAG: hypothetical protein IKU23_07355 [Clostridia bacterium]|nr:hypothetical protein [Clostridia bacterium]